MGLLPLHSPMTTVEAEREDIYLLLDFQERPNIDTDIREIVSGNFELLPADDDSGKKCLFVTKGKTFEANLTETIGTDVFVNLDASGSGNSHRMEFVGKSTQRLLMEQLVYLPSANTNKAKNND